MSSDSKQGLSLSAEHKWQAEKKRKSECQSLSTCESITTQGPISCILKCISAANMVSALYRTSVSISAVVFEEISSL